MTLLHVQSWQPLGATVLLPSADFLTTREEWTRPCIPALYDAGGGFHHNIPPAWAVMETTERTMRTGSRQVSYREIEGYVVGDRIMARARYEMLHRAEPPRHTRKWVVDRREPPTPIEERDA